MKITREQALEFVKSTSKYITKLEEENECRRLNKIFKYTDDKPNTYLQKRHKYYEMGDTAGFENLTRNDEGLPYNCLKGFAREVRYYETQTSILFEIMEEHIEKGSKEYISPKTEARIE